MSDNYRIIETQDLHSLVEFVNKAIEEGWKPIGGVTAYEESYMEGSERKQIIFLQAVTRT